MATSPATPPPDVKTSSQLSSPQLNVENYEDPATPPIQAASIISHSSAPQSPPGFASPMRHHKRAPSAHRPVKETLDAKATYMSDETDGRTHHRVNQYVIHEEIGRGSYGAVHRGTDHLGTEYAIKEFSKARLRKRARTNIMRQGPQRFRHLMAGPDGSNPLGLQMRSVRVAENKDALHLIRQEIAIMKKLDHQNLVRLIEVLDDPEEDSLYMVMEMCQKGVVMKVGLDEQAKPVDQVWCRTWFRDLILGIEYLHAQGVIHRDIKPDNLLLSDDDVLKIVDFGVSEMFEMEGDMRTTKSAGSPAFLPPELCDKHGDVSGKAADIWSMGITLFCLRYGHIPFKRDGMLEIYEAIRTDEPSLPANEDPDLRDLLTRILEKDPQKRINMTELREHPWVTQRGSDPLLPMEENCAHVVEPPNELELNHAFTRKMNHLLSMMKAIHRFKELLVKVRSRSQTQLVESRPSQSDSDALPEHVLALLDRRRELKKPMGGKQNQVGSPKLDGGEQTLFLGIGTGARDDFAMDEASPDVVANSPDAVDFDVYDRAYADAVAQHRQGNKDGKRPIMYLNKFVQQKDRFVRGLENIVEGTELPEALQNATSHLPSPPKTSMGSLPVLVSKIGLSSSAKAKGQEEQQERPENSQDVISS